VTLGAVIDAPGLVDEQQEGYQNAQQEHEENLRTRVTSTAQELESSLME
jgi:hypothetical protein